MLTAITSRLTGAAAKAGIAALFGAVGAPGAAATADYLTNNDVTMSLLGYIVVGALGGAANWAAVYFKRNDGYK